jgi:hypothetical protein
MKTKYLANMRKGVAAVATAIALTIGGWAAITGAAELRAQAGPVCHSNPDICTTWVGYDCEGACIPGQGICCQPDVET